MHLFLNFQVRSNKEIKCSPVLELVWCQFGVSVDAELTLESAKFLFPRLLPFFGAHLTTEVFGDICRSDISRLALQAGFPARVHMTHHQSRPDLYRFKYDLAT